MLKKDLILSWQKKRRDPEENISKMKLSNNLKKVNGNPEIIVNNLLLYEKQKF